ncbi:rhomboid protease ROM10, putative [Plasmodium gallinaceum]|uniref:Rhomboid-like protease n=1 Tax=Plasmodium gallinaceum TaxID=5849 RepID=A0A1J1GN22_PLAGA|nr:rhomboid protease ROM10, putative [Plasmodium gallinaceum]CRG93764.1 rhomboid protease ROM10, putative [Plasmodium gallinaceum]
MNFHSNSSNHLNYEHPYDSNLLIQKYTQSFNNTFKRDIKFIQILFPTFDIFSITFFFSLFLILIFLCLDVYFFNSQKPLYINEDILKNIGINKFYISNGYHYYKIISATFIHSNIWNLIINTYYLMNIGIIIEKNYGKLKYIILMFLCAICGNLLTCATAKCNDIQMGISPILSGFIGVFLQEIIMHYNDVKDKLSVIGNFIFAFLSLYLMISIFPYNGNIFGNTGGLFVGISYPFIFKSDSFNNTDKKLKITFIILIILLISATLSSIIIFKC